MEGSIPGATELPVNNATPAQLKEQGLNPADESKFKPIGEAKPAITDSNAISKEERNKIINDTSGQDLSELTKENLAKSNEKFDKLGDVSKSVSHIDGVEFGVIDKASNPTTVEVTEDNKSINQEQTPGSKSTEKPDESVTKESKPEGKTDIGESPATIDQSKEQKQEAKQTQEAESDSLESMLADEIKKARQETQESWTKLIDTVDTDRPNNPNPYHVTFEYNGEKALFFIQPVKVSSTNPEKYYIAITREGPKKMPATKEANNMMYKGIINQEEDYLKNPDLTPVSLDDDYSVYVVNTAIKGSAEKATAIGAERKTLEELRAGKSAADEAKAFVVHNYPPSTLKK
jgi:hypothetical protein